MTNATTIASIYLSQWKQLNCSNIFIELLTFVNWWVTKCVCDRLHPASFVENSHIRTKNLIFSIVIAHYKSLLTHVFFLERNKKHIHIYMEFHNCVHLFFTAECVCVCAFFHLVFICSLSSHNAWPQSVECHNTICRRLECIIPLKSGVGRSLMFFFLSSVCAYIRFHIRLYFFFFKNQLQRRPTTRTLYTRTSHTNKIYFNLFSLGCSGQWCLLLLLL